MPNIVHTGGQSFYIDAVDDKYHIAIQHESFKQIEVSSRHRFEKHVFLTLDGEYGQTNLENGDLWIGLDLETATQFAKDVLDRVQKVKELQMKKLIGENHGGA